MFYVIGLPLAIIVCIRNSIVDKNKACQSINVNIGLIQFIIIKCINQIAAYLLYRCDMLTCSSAVFLLYVLNKNKFANSIALIHPLFE